MKTTIGTIKRIIREEIQQLTEGICPCGIEREDCTYHYEGHNDDVQKYFDEVRDYWYVLTNNRPSDVSEDELEELIDSVTAGLNDDGVNVDKAVVRDIVYEMGGFNNP